MFEKFTERGRKVIIYAREEAEKRQNDYLGTEHLLLGMIREGEGRYTAWKKRNQSLSYVFKEELEYILANQDLDTVFAK